jgi:hypothetical protein
MSHELLDNLITSEILTDGSRKFSDPVFAITEVIYTPDFFLPAIDVFPEYIESRRKEISKVRISYEVPRRKEFNSNYGRFFMCLHGDWSAAVYHEDELTKLRRESLTENALWEWLKR